MFHGVTDNATARTHARTIAEWVSPPPVSPVTWLHSRKER
jgi:hypothetical protein